MSPAVICFANHFRSKKSYQAFLESKLQNQNETNLEFFLISSNIFLKTTRQESYDNISQLPTPKSNKSYTW
jgi:hypothetical protein